MDNKTFYYNRLLYLFNVKLTGVFCGLLIIGCLYLSVFSQINFMLLAIITLVASYTIWNCFISKSNSQSVTIGEDKISFYALGRTDSYMIDQIQKIRIREFPTGGRMYIRINDHGLFKGRYWVHFGKFEEGKILMKKLLDIEYAIHPDSLKARARRINTEFINQRKTQNRKS